MLARRLRNRSSSRSSAGLFGRIALSSPARPARESRPRVGGNSPRARARGIASFSPLPVRKPAKTNTCRRRETRRSPAPQAFFTDDELWPKLGDGGVRKAAYRGG